MADVLTAPTDTSRVAGAVQTKEKPAPVLKPEPKPEPTPSLGTGNYQATLASDRSHLEQMGEPKPPNLTPMPKPVIPDDPFQAFGQPAMWLAALGGLFARNHLTSAIQSAGAVLKAVDQKNDKAMEQAMTEWKVNSENAMKLVKYEQDAYKNAIAKYSADAKAGEAEVRTLGAAFKNSALTHIYETEGMDGVVKYFKKSGSDAALAEERRLKLDGHLEQLRTEHEMLTAWTQANPQATPQQVAAAKLTIMHGKDPSEVLTKDYSAPQEVKITDEDGKERPVLAQQDKRDGRWVTADEHRTPIMGENGQLHLVKGQKNPSVAEKDQNDRNTIAAATEAQKIKDAGGTLTAEQNKALADARAAQARIDEGIKIAAEKARAVGGARVQTTPWVTETDPTTHTQFRTRTGPDGKPEYQDLRGDKIEAPGGAARLGAEAKPGSQYGKPVEVYAVAPDGTRTPHLAMMENGTSKWVSADENHTPIKGTLFLAKDIRLDDKAEQARSSLVAERTTRFKELKAEQEAAGTYKGESGVWDAVNQAMYKSKNAQFPPGVAEIVADQIIAGNAAAASGFGRSPNMLAQLDSVLAKRMAEHVPPLTGADLAKLKVDYAAYTQGVKAFTAGGKLAGVPQYLGVAVDHLDLLQKTAQALAQHNTGFLNAIQNTLEREMGFTAPPTFDAIRQTVAAEIEKAVSGTAGAVSDREDLKSNLNKNLAPDQLMSVISAYEGLMAGQLNGVRTTYQHVQNLGGQTGGDFDKEFLTQRARDVLSHRSGGHGTQSAPQTGGASIPQAALAHLKEGIPTTFKNGQTWMLKEGKPVQVQ